MGEILSKDTVDLLKNDKVRKAVRTLVERDGGAVGGVSVTIQSPRGQPETVNLRIAST